MLILMGAIWQVTGFVFIWIILSQFRALGGWSFDDISFLYGFRLFVHALSMLIFGMFQRIGGLVRSGDFDVFLVQPPPPLLRVMTHRFPIAAFGDLLSGVLVFAVANMHAKVDWSFLAVLYLLLAILGGCLVEAGIKLATSSLAFRALSVSSLVGLFDEVLRVTGSYPLTIYANSIRLLFTFVIPVAFLAYFPATVLLHRTNELSVNPVIAYLSPLVGIILFSCAYLFFHNELKHYQSAGH